MQITIKTKNLDLTPALKDWIDDKIGGLEKFLQKYEEQGQILCEVEVARTTKHHNKGDVFYAEAHLNLPGGRLRAKHQDFDARVAIDKVRDMLQRDILRHKEKRGISGKAMRHLSRFGRGAAGAAGKLVWWRNK